MMEMVVTTGAVRTSTAGSEIVTTNMLTPVFYFLQAGAAEPFLVSCHPTNNVGALKNNLDFFLL